ncbi:hypothetical protein ACQPZQ_45305 [Pseudonocardia sp. CA-142604]|uniref:hypothetical protein n=1 Tax=Pseudonocardia sp. CA-142604 TaxID=3240024 RepID=UPI003D93DD85
MKPQRPEDNGFEPLNFVGVTGERLQKMTVAKVFGGTFARPVGESFPLAVLPYDNPCDASRRRRSRKQARDARTNARR